MKKIFLCIAMVCAIGMMTACKYEMSVKTMGTIDTGDSSSVLLTNEYHFKDLNTPNSLQVVYINYRPNLEKDSIEMGNDRFPVVADLQSATFYLRICNPVVADTRCCGL